MLGAFVEGAGVLTGAPVSMGALVFPGASGAGVVRMVGEGVGKAPGGRTGAGVLGMDHGCCVGMISSAGGNTLGAIVGSGVGGAKPGIAVVGNIVLPTGAGMRVSMGTDVGRSLLRAG